MAWGAVKHLGPLCPAMPSMRSLILLAKVDFDFHNASRRLAMNQDLTQAVARDVNRRPREKGATETFRHTMETGKRDGIFEHRETSEPRYTV